MSAIDIAFAVGVLLAALAGMSAIGAFIALFACSLGVRREHDQKRAELKRRLFSSELSAEKRRVA